MIIEVKSFAFETTSDFDFPFYKPAGIIQTHSKLVSTSDLKSPLSKNPKEETWIHGSFTVAFQTALVLLRYPLVLHEVFSVVEGSLTFWH